MEPVKDSPQERCQNSSASVQTPDSRKPQPIRFTNPLVNGAAAGALEVSLMHPTLIWKNCRQLKQPIPRSFWALYQGLPISYAVSVPMFALMHGTNQMVSRCLGNSPHAQTVSTVAAAANTTIALHGVEALIIQKSQLNAPWKNVVQRTWTDYRFAVLTRGAVASFCRNLAYCMGMYKCTEPIARLVYRRLSDTKWEISKDTAHLTATVLSGGLCGFLAHPFDTVKTRLQMDLGRKRYHNGVTLTRQAWSKYGLTWFYRGMVPHFVRFSVGAGLFYWASEKLEK